MNILDVIASILAMENVFLGVLPESPNTLIVLAEYAGASSEAFFDRTERPQAIQARCRALDSNTAYQAAVAVQSRLDRYVGQGIVIRQTTPVLDIGQDTKGRREYTVNFKIDYTGG